MSNTCGSEEKKYALYITKKLQSQYHDPEIKPVYDRALGEKFNTVFGTLSITQKNAIRWAHLWEKDLKPHMKTPTRHMASELRSAYHALAARL